MRARTGGWIAFALLLFSLGAAAQEKEVAITIDDLPLNGPNIGIARMRTMTGSLLEAFHNHRVPVVGFVNESLLYVPGETESRTALLKMWAMQAPNSVITLSVIRGSATFLKTNTKTMWSVATLLRECL